MRMPRQRSSGSVFTNRVGSKSLGRPKHQSRGVPRSSITYRSGTATPSQCPIRYASSTRTSGAGIELRRRRRNRTIRSACPIAMSAERQTQATRSPRDIEAVLGNDGHRDTGGTAASLEPATACSSLASSGAASSIALGGPVKAI